jgi:hypothetical protein
MKHDLQTSLFRELFQTERSATRHPVIEADRLDGAGPARAFLAVTRHAERVLPELPRLAEARGIAPSVGGLSVGVAFSRIRNGFADLLLTTERSYRMTLVGMRHGVDVVTLLGAVAERRGDRDLVAFCDTWLEERVPLVEACARSLSWFAGHEAEALAPAKRGFLGRAAQSVLGRVGDVEQLLSSVMRPAIPRLR